MLSKRPAHPLWQPVREFLHTEAFSGVLLLAATVVALAWANSPWHAVYERLLHAPILLTVGGSTLDHSLLHWINDGLMVLFFFVVGLEIKREVLVGELASLGRAALPIAAAIGGMVVPAAVYASINVGGPGASGWAVPMATDIAFSLGLLSLLGDRVPPGIKVFLAALAIVDDLGAVLVIAIFYSGGIAWMNLLIGAGLLVLSLIANRLGVRGPLIYGLIGVILWLTFLESGIHATVAGVLLAFTIPTRQRIDSAAFANEARELVGEFERVEDGDADTNDAQRDLVRELERRCEQVQAPAQRLEDMLHPWVAYGIMPLFALANAGVRIDGVSGVATNPIAIGVVAGLVLGKPLGVFGASWLATRARIATLPEGVGLYQVFGVSCLTGIGFTMSLFIAGLAFDESGQAVAKTAILVGSAVAAVLGLVVVHVASPPRAAAAIER